MTNAATPQQPAAPGPAAEPKHTTVCGIIAVVFGALGLVLSFIPIINNLAAILGGIGVVLAVVALVGTFRGRKRGKALSVVAAVLCVAAIAITLSMQSAASKAIDDSLKESKGIATSQSQGASAPASAAAKTQNGEGDVEGAHVKIVSAVKSGNDYEGHPTVLVTFAWTNATSKNNSFASLLHAQAFQNGGELATAIYMEQPEGYDGNSYMAEAQPNGGGTVTLGYVLKDDSPVTVEVSPFLALNDESKVTHEFTLQ